MIVPLVAGGCTDFRTSVYLHGVLHVVQPRRAKRHGRDLSKIRASHKGPRRPPGGASYTHLGDARNLMVRAGVVSCRPLMVNWSLGIARRSSRGRDGTQHIPCLRTPLPCCAVPHRCSIRFRGDVRSHPLAVSGWLFVS